MIIEAKPIRAVIRSSTRRMIHEWDSSSSRISLCCVGLLGRSTVKDATRVMVEVEVTIASSEE